jgi:glycosyltransferase involved in cell wall biosynthesis
MPSHQQLFDQFKVCVLIPTYNNELTVKEVVASVADYTTNIVVVNDGSTDATPTLLAQQSIATVINYSPNRGKGHALKVGFRWAIEQGYTYTITIDSDGQHFATDLPAFINAIAEYPHHLIIGARNMNQAHIPGKSSFGNRFSNFWFWVETGITLPDTQSGYRVYPLSPMAKMRFFTRKYEFEIETPVRLAWKGVPVMSIPIGVYYPPATERVTHFRPFKDFSRISVLNTFLTFIALFWIHPCNFLKLITSKKGWQKIWKQVVVRQEETNYTKAMSVGFGVFMGIFPVWGFQLAIGIPLSIYFKLNKALFLLAANISIFPLTPIFWALSLWTGKYLLGYKEGLMPWHGISLEQFKAAGTAFFLGGTVLAIGLGLLAFSLTYISLLLWRKPIKSH